MKKDPGVPNSAPFKEEVLREAEQRRLKVGFIQTPSPLIIWFDTGLLYYSYKNLCILYKSSRFFFFYFSINVRTVMPVSKMSDLSFLRLKKKKKNSNKPKRKNEL